LALEEHRRSTDGRVRTSQEMLANFFPFDEKSCTDKVFKYLPNDVRGPIVAAWGIRGLKAALRDTDDKVQNVVHDALVAGDVDHAAFEQAVTAETLVRWLPLADVWAFWRGGKLTKGALFKALSTAYELYLFDGRWFLDTIQAKGGSLKGTDVLAEGLGKEDLSAWVKRIAESGDGTPKGIVAALGWEKIVAKTSNEVLVSVLDAIVTKVGLVAPPPARAEMKSQPDKQLPAVVAPPPASAEVAAAPPQSEPPADVGNWSKLPPPPDTPADGLEPTSKVVEAAGSEEPINVVLEDELVIAPPPGDDDDDAEQTMIADRPPAPLPRPSKPPMRWEKKR
jgi:hypothetical protein